MTLGQARAQFAQKIADVINESKLNPTIIRLTLAEIDRTLAQLEEQQYQQSIAEKEVKDA